MQITPQINFDETDIRTALVAYAATEHQLTIDPARIVFSTFANGQVAARASGQPFK